MAQVREHRIVLPTSQRARASILIAADRNAELLARCLESVARNAGREVPFETIVVLNASSESVVRLVNERVAGMKVVETGVNRGVAGAYNLGREAATGEFLVLLHDDAEVWPGSGWSGRQRNAPKREPSEAAPSTPTGPFNMPAQSCGATAPQGPSAWASLRALPHTQCDEPWTSAAAARSSCAPRPGMPSARSTSVSFPSPTSTWTCA